MLEEASLFSIGTAKTCTRLQRIHPDCIRWARNCTSTRLQEISKCWFPIEIRIWFYLVCGWMVWWLFSIEFLMRFPNQSPSRTSSAQQKCIAAAWLTCFREWRSLHSTTRRNMNQSRILRRIAEQWDCSRYCPEKTLISWPDLRNSFYESSLTSAVCTQEISSKLLTLWRSAELFYSHY